ncbi:MAG: hypothetical protein ACE5E8_04660 [Acidimicrobiia bacterium]
MIVAAVTDPGAGRRRTWGVWLVGLVKCVQLTRQRPFGALSAAPAALFF